MINIMANYEVLGPWGGGVGTDGLHWRDAQNAKYAADELLDSLMLFVSTRKWQCRF